MAAESLFELRRRTFEGPELRGIEFIEVEAKTILNKVPGNYLPFRWTVNPYRGCTHACTYCFARVTHTFMDFDAGRDFESKIVVKVNAPELLRAGLAAKRWKGEGVAMGTATDPYQRGEGRYKLMPPIIEALIDARNPFSILTKGTLILRDLDLLAEAASMMDVSTQLSIPTLDEAVWRASEPGTPHPLRRMEAVKALNDAGVSCGVMIAPILPGISDSEAMLRDVVRAAIDAGATHISPIALHLRPVVREEFMQWLSSYAPGLVPEYRELFAGGAYQSSRARRELSDRVKAIVDAEGGLRAAQAAPRLQKVRGPRPPEKPEQLRLL